MKKTTQIWSFQRDDKPSHSVSVLRAGAHEYQFAPRQYSSFLEFKGFHITLKKANTEKNDPNSGRFHVIYELENLFNFYNARHFF